MIEAGANRRAGEFRPRLRKKGRAFLETKEDGTDKAGGVPIRLSGNRIRFVEEGRDPAQTSREHRCGRSETTHPEDNLGLEAAEDRPAKGKAFAEPPNKRKDRRRKRRRQRDRRQSLVAEFGSAFDREGIDLLFRNKKEHLVAPRPQHFCHGQTGKEMSASSAAGDHRIHERNPPLHWRFADDRAIVPPGKSARQRTGPACGLRPRTTNSLQ